MDKNELIESTEKPSQESINRWYEHKSNKEKWIERQEYLLDNAGEE